MARAASTRGVATATTTVHNQPISSFARVSKSQVIPLASEKKAAPFTAVCISETTTPASRKRKASTVEDGNNTCPRLSKRNAPTIHSEEESDDEAECQVAVKRTCRREEQQFPIFDNQKTSKSTAKVAAKGKAPAKATTARSRKAHKPSESTIVSQSRQSAKSIQTTLDYKLKRVHQKRPEQAGSTQDSLPPQLLELVQLHRAFLKTIVLQFSHSGSNVPVDIRTITPNIARTWGKRQVTIEDIQRCIALQSSTRNGSASPFVVSDYGRGKICIELDASRSGDATSPINEDLLCRQFEDNLRALCAERAADEMADVDIPFEGLSLTDLPKAAITSMDSGSRTNPLLSKGHRALSELKNGIVARQQDKEAKQAAPENRPMLSPDGSKMSLLDRLRFKQLAASQGPAEPSSIDLQRRAALNRAADVVATISMLSLSNPMSLPRQAFTMASILDRLKDSLRVPLSSEEGSACVRLIAGEIAPEWLRIVTIGGRENVVVQRQSQPVDRVIQERVRKLMG